MPLGPMSGATAIQKTRQVEKQRACHSPFRYEVVAALRLDMSKAAVVEEG